jgi:hypothetical protein
MAASSPSVLNQLGDYIMSRWGSSIDPGFFRLDMSTIRVATRAELDALAAGAGSGYETPPPQVYFSPEATPGPEGTPEPSPAPQAAAEPAAAEPAAAESLKERIIAFLAAPKGPRWAEMACDLLSEVDEARGEMAMDRDLRDAAYNLISGAQADCDFAHCYLNIADDLYWMLRELYGPR